MAVILSLVTLLIIFQLTISLILKRSIYKSQYFKFIALLLLDFVFTVLFIIGSNYHWPLIIQRFFLLFDLVGLALFFLLYMGILNSQYKKRSVLAFIIFLLGSIFIVMFGDLVLPFISMGTLLVIGLLVVLILKPTSQYTSKYFALMIYLLVLTEIIRLLTTGLVAYEFLYHNTHNPWLASIPFIVKTITVFIVIEIHDKMILDKNLQQSLDQITPTALLTRTFTEHPDAVVFDKYKARDFIC